jgi:serine protease Do
MRNISRRSQPGTLLNAGWVLVFILPICIGLMSGPVAAQGLPSYADLAEQVGESVVAIFATKIEEIDPSAEGVPPDSMEDFFRRFFEEQMPGSKNPVSALGTGFIIDSGGLIVTNHHVVAKANEIKIRMHNMKEYDARIVGRDPKTDLALIQVKPDGEFPQPAKLGDSDKLRVGDGVMAAGNPFGLSQTVTVGIISAKGRIIGAGPYDDFLQTDAAINPGNSGGPLFNSNGEVVGVNSAIVATGQGISFAIPINLVRELLPQLKTGRVTRGWIGVMIQDLTEELARSFGLKGTDGVLVADVVPGAPADAGGIKRGDVIASINGEQIENVHELSRMIAGTKPQSQLDVTVTREQKTQNLKIQAGAMPQEEAAAVPAESQMSQQQEGSKEQLGLAIQTLTPEISARLGWGQNEKGVLVSGVDPMSKAERAGLEMGDLIKEIDRTEINSADEMHQRMQQGGPKNKELLLLVKRGENTFYTVLQG